ncbi:MAG: subB3 [Frankiales bacterium]|nr:subB3 [Frankiales bacterium]
MHVTVDAEACEAYGQCVMRAPQVFDLGDEDLAVTLLDAHPAEALTLPVQAAAAACPVAAITVGQ